MIEFYLILAAIAKVPGGVFWRLMIGTLVMLVGGYVGEAGYAPVWPAFIVGMLGWFYILYEIFAGEASKINAASAPPSVQSAFSLMRWIVTIGWAIYPIGYFFGYLTGSSPADSAAALNIIYNLADVLNKIAFGLIIWKVAVTESETAKHYDPCVCLKKNPGCGRDFFKNCIKSLMRRKLAWGRLFQQSTHTRVI